MGNTAGKGKHEPSTDSFHDLSGHGRLSEREASSAWYRYGVSVTDVYDVVEVLGQGHMGEVFTVRRKTTGHHTDLTREKMKESEVDLKLMLKNEEEAKERARRDTKEKKSRVSLSLGSSPGRKSSFGSATSPGRKSSLRGAAHKAKKVIKNSVSVKGSKGPAILHEDANSDLAPFIGSDSHDLNEAQREPPKSNSATSTPLKSIIKEGQFHSSDCLPSSVRSRSDSGSSPFPYYVRKSTLESPTDIEKALKGVHFQRTFAVKTILTSRINKDQLQELVNEIMIMRKLDHPYVLKLYEVYHVKRKLWLVTELLAGGDLSSRKLNEHDTKNVIEQVLRALVYLHRMGIVHRDIKLENIMYENHSKQATVRLIDFGLSRTFDRTSIAADYARTPYTMSPEAAAMSARKSNVGHEVMTDKTDVWAVGVITFIMLSGEFPFIKTNTDLKNQVKMDTLSRADFHFGVTWKGRGITGKAKEFVKGCLQMDPNERWTAKQALEYLQKGWAPEVDRIWDAWRAEIKKNMKPEFVQPQDLPGDNDNDDDENSDAGSQSSLSSLLAENNDDGEPPASFDNEARAKHIKNHVRKVVRAKKAEGPITEQENEKIDMEEIERYTKFGFMKKTILITMANTMDRGDVGKLREIFLKADTEDTGTITLRELIAAFRELSPEVDEKRVEELFFGIDRDKSGHIHYAEFLAALAESHGLVTLDRLTEAFDRIDTDGKGYITHDDLKSILGKDYDKGTVDEMIEEGDFKKNNKIDYEELLQLMFSDPVKGDELAGSVSPGVSFGGD
mmetsp:Transcript_12921/g.28099  ORF Transcript_12921/g.28099 Transcript_12921/m.28099 type:complete len:787 (-) Transcript_12921:162-2522(-)